MAASSRTERQRMSPGILASSRPISVRNGQSNMLRVDSLTVAYGGLQALTEVTLEVNAGEMVSVVGPNGAGKSTLFKAISGTVAVASGKISFEGADLLSK